MTADSTDAVNSSIHQLSLAKNHQNDLGQHDGAEIRLCTHTHRFLMPTLDADPVFESSRLLLEISMSPAPLNLRQGERVSANWITWNALQRTTSVGCGLENRKLLGGLPPRCAVHERLVVLQESPSGGSVPSSVKHERNHQKTTQRRRNRTGLMN